MSARAIIGGVAATGAAGAIAITALRRNTSVEDPEAQMRAELQQQLGDMLALTRHMTAALEKQLESTKLLRFNDARSFVQRAHDVLESQSSSIARELESVGGDGASSLKSAMTSVTGTATGLLGRVRPESVSRTLRDDYTALSFASISYSMLHTTALSLHNQSVAQLAQQHLKELAGLVMRLSDEVPKAVVNELAREALPVDVTVGAEAVEHAQQAWAQSASQVHSRA